MYRGRIPVFSKQIVLYNDAVKLLARERWAIPFELSFPPTFRSIQGDDWVNDPRFDNSPEQSLPPSFRSSYHGFTTHYDSYIEYRIGADIYVPHVSVGILMPQKYNEPLICYAPAPSPLLPQRTFYQPSRRIVVRDELLLPEEQRPSGFRQKAKARLSENYYPRFTFDWKLVAPQQVHVGQPMAFEISVRVRERDCTALVVPEIRVSSFVVSLTGMTTVRAEKQWFSTPEADHEDSLVTLRGVLDDSGPFSKAGDWKKTINTAALPETIAPSFRTVNISQTHFIRLRMGISVVGKTFPSEIQFNVDVLPPTAGGSSIASSANPGVAAGPSSQPRVMQQPDEPLPRYEDVPPDYHVAVEAAASQSSSKNARAASPC